MDSNLNLSAMEELRKKGVDNIDDEIYYAEILGCQARMNGDTCAAIDCGQGEIKLCEKPESTARR